MLQIWVGSLKKHVYNMQMIITYIVILNLKTLKAAHWMSVKIFLNWLPGRNQTISSLTPTKQKQFFLHLNVQVHYIVLVILTHTKSSHLDKVLERVRSYKILGVIFTEDLTWNPHVNKITQSALMIPKTLRLLNRFMAFHTCKQLAQSLVLSKLEYAKCHLS